MLWGGGGGGGGGGDGEFSSRRNYSFVITFLVCIFVGRIMDIFLKLIGVHDFSFFHLIFLCSNIFVCLYFDRTSPPPPPP